MNGWDSILTNLRHGKCVGMNGYEIIGINKKGKEFFTQ